MLRSSSICEVLDFWFAYLTNADLDKRGVGYCALQIPYSKTISFLGTKGLIEYAHKYNIAVQFWTINESDDVAFLQSIRRGLHNVRRSRHVLRRPERLRVRFFSALTRQRKVRIRPQRTRNPLAKKRQSRPAEQK